MSPTKVGSEGVGYPGLPGFGKKDRYTNGHTNGELVSRPELEVFGLAMLGGGKVFGAAHPYGMLMPCCRGVRTSR